MDGFFDELDVLPGQHGLEDRLDDADMAMDWIKEGMLQDVGFQHRDGETPAWDIMGAAPFDAPDDDEEEETKHQNRNNILIEHNYTGRKTKDEQTSRIRQYVRIDNT